MVNRFENCLFIIGQAKTWRGSYFLKNKLSKIHIAPFCFVFYVYVQNFANAIWFLFTVLTYGPKRKEIDVADFRFTIFLWKYLLWGKSEKKSYNNSINSFRVLILTLALPHKRKLHYTMNTISLVKCFWTRISKRDWYSSPLITFQVIK